MSQVTSSKKQLRMTSAWDKARDYSYRSKRVIHETAREREGHCGERRVDRDEGTSDACPKAPSISGSSNFLHRVRSTARPFSRLALISPSAPRCLMVTKSTSFSSSRAILGCGETDND